jgi:hypothetical protein
MMFETGLLTGGVAGGTTVGGLVADGCLGAGWVGRPFGAAAKVGMATTHIRAAAIKDLRSMFVSFSGKGRLPEEDYAPSCRNLSGKTEELAKK